MQFAMRIDCDGHVATLTIGDIHVTQAVAGGINSTRHSVSIALHGPSTDDPTVGAETRRNPIIVLAQ
jgi:hypothetical protein